MGSCASAQRNGRLIHVSKSAGQDLEDSDEIISPLNCLNPSVGALKQCIKSAMSVSHQGKEFTEVYRVPHSAEELAEETPTLKLLVSAPIGLVANKPRPDAATMAANLQSKMYHNSSAIAQISVFVSFLVSDKDEVIYADYSGANMCSKLLKLKKFMKDPRAKCKSQGQFIISLDASWECTVCFGQHSVFYFPEKPTASCEHLPLVCADAIRQTIRAGLADSNWNCIRCPVDGCPAVF
jgi:hypothetical protein